MVFGELGHTPLAFNRVHGTDIEDIQTSRGRQDRTTRGKTEEEEGGERIEFLPGIEPGTRSKI